jgi:hypothetical protein
VDLQKWWASMTPEQQREIHARAVALNANADLVGKRDARCFPRQGTRAGERGQAAARPTR